MWLIEIKMENKYVEVDLGETDRDHKQCESQESGDNLANIFKLGSNQFLNLSYNMNHI